MTFTRVVYVAANNEKDARQAAYRYLAGDRWGESAVADNPDDIGPRARAKFKNVYRVVQELGHRGKMRYLVDRPDKPPFKNGDTVHGLHRGINGGTMLGNGEVISCELKTDHPGYWSVVVDFGGKANTFTVNGKGKDTSGYLSKGPMKS